MNNSSLLNRFFSRKNLDSFINGVTPCVFSNVLNKCNIVSENKLNVQLIREVYEYLDESHRNEYFYKNTLLNELLVNHKYHSIENTVAITELPVAKSKLDFLLINGKAIVYEVKTELDNFERLSSQLNDYYKAFDHVVVVTCRSNLEKLKKILTYFPMVGISLINENRKIEEIRAPISYKLLLDKKCIFNVLRKSEFESLLKELNCVLPQVSQFLYYNECFKLFLNYEIEIIYPLFLKQLKKRKKILKEEFLLLPEEIKELAYFSNLRVKDYKKLNKYLNLPYSKE